MMQLMTMEVFSSKPFEKLHSYELIRAAKLGDILKVKECLNENRYLVFDFDHVRELSFIKTYRLV